jgi:hypothetical protein
MGVRGIASGIQGATNYRYIDTTEIRYPSITIKNSLHHLAYRNIIHPRDIHYFLIYADTVCMQQLFVLSSDLPPL